jgi:cell division protein ZapA (FtsZ GTPase activity inhibitor)
VKSHWDKKIDRFGLMLDEILELGRIRNLKILHYHIGSQIEVENDIIVALREAFTAYQKIREVNPENQILSTQMLLLVAMNMADESLREQNENRQFREKIRSKSESILTRLEQEFALGAE